MTIRNRCPSCTRGNPCPSCSERWDATLKQLRAAPASLATVRPSDRMAGYYPTYPIKVADAAPEAKDMYNYVYAYNYVVRAIRGRQGKGKADCPTTVRARKVSSSVDAFDPSIIDDICQDGFLSWHRSRRGGRKQLDTRGAIRFAVRAWRRAERRTARPVRRSCELCSSVEPCQSCQDRIAADTARWAAANRASSFGPNVREAITYVNTTVTDLIPTAKGKAWRKQAATVLRWLASGSTLGDVAKHMGVSTPYVHKIICKLRTILTPELFGVIGHQRGETLPPAPSGIRPRPLSPNEGPVLLDWTRPGIPYAHSLVSWREWQADGSGI